MAAPVKINPRIGPAHGAHSNPVDKPRINDWLTLGFDTLFCPWTLAPSRTKGRVKYSATLGKSNASPNKAKTTIANHLPIWLARTTHAPAYFANPATTEKVMAIPARRGSPLR